MCWLFEYIFKSDTNVKIVSYNLKHLIKEKDYNYHCSLISLLYYLDYEYENIFFEPLLENINNDILFTTDYKKNTYVINWKGNIKNTHELYNRSIPIEKLIKLFKLSNINWIVITKNITKQELFILNKYNIKYCGDKIDINKSFCDSINILKKVDGVITTDTSIAHLSLNMNLNTYKIKSIIVITILILTSLYSNAQSPIGAWERYYDDDNGNTIRSVVIFSEKFQYTARNFAG